jgi:hypothetical protein
LRVDENRSKCSVEFGPEALITEIIATAIPAAMRPYSIAVAADSSFRKVLNFPAVPGNVAGDSEAFVKLQARN